MRQNIPDLPYGRAQLVRLLSTSGDVIRVDDAVSALQLNRTAAAQRLSRWTEQGWLRRVGRGAYVAASIDTMGSDRVLDDPWVLVPALFAPAYIGGRAAAEHWDLTEQIFRDVLVMTAQAVRKKRQVRQGALFSLKHVDEQRIFGTKSVWRHRTRVSVSDIHRTIIDMLDDPAVGGGIQHVADCLGSYLRRGDRDDGKLIEYAVRLGNGAVFKRLGFLAERLPGGDQLAHLCEHHLSGGHAARPCTRWNARRVQVETTRAPALGSRRNDLIEKREILAVSQQTSLTPHVVEKDYVLGWMLAGIYGHEELRENWVFKGGTCLKKCFFETYRFSEDLDFTLLKPEHLDVDFLKNAFSEIGEWIYEQTGVEIPPDSQEFDIYSNPRGQFSCQGKISYRGPVSSTHGLPHIKLDLTADERVVVPPVRVRIFHPYTDAPGDGIEVLAYDYIEAFAEKFRALAERTRPRDLYDVVNLYRNGQARPEPRRFMEVLRAKCEFKGISIPRIADLEAHRADLEAGWMHMLEHQLPALLPVATFWDALPEIFAWLEGAVSQPLAAMPIGAGDTVIRERSISLASGGRGQNYIEMIRFAASNRLLVEIDYLDKQGNRSMRAIEAYSLRRSQAGDVLLMGVRADNGQSRSYLVDSILGVRTTQESFSPRYPIELTPSGPQNIPQTTSSALGGRGGIRNAPVIRRSPGRRPIRTAGFSGASGPTFIFKCTVCGKTFNRETYDATLNNHKNSRTGYDCYGTFGTYLKTKY